MSSKRWSHQKTDKTLLRMVNYLAKFTPSLAQPTASMGKLLKKDSEFVRDSAQDTVFNHMKKVITSAGTLVYDDVNKEVTLEVDTSKHGIGTVLLQAEKPFAYASMSLSPTDQDYVQLERRCMQYYSALSASINTSMADILK